VGIAGTCCVGGLVRAPAGIGGGAVGFARGGGGAVGGLVRGVPAGPLALGATGVAIGVEIEPLAVGASDADTATGPLDGVCGRATTGPLDDVLDRGGGGGGLVGELVRSVPVAAGSSDTEVSRSWSATRRAADPGGGGGAVLALGRALSAIGLGSGVGAAADRASLAGGSTLQPDARSAMRPFVSSPRRRRFRSSSGTSER